MAFACAGDGWAFTLGQFAEIYAAKMGANPKALQKVRPDAIGERLALRCRSCLPRRQLAALPAHEQHAIGWGEHGRRLSG